MSRLPLVVAGPLPPPYHGVTISTSLVLASPELHRRFEVWHLDTSDHRTGQNVERWDTTNIRLALGSIARLAVRTRGPRGVVYLPLSQSTPGVLRDSLLVLIAASRGWKVAVHLRGSEFRSFYAGANPFVRRLARTALRQVDGIAVMGTSLRHVFDGLVPAERISVVPNGTPEPRLDGSHRDRNHVVFLSNLRRRKGVVQALDAALLVLERHPQARFSFVGEWEDEQLERELRQKATRANGAVAFCAAVEPREKEELLGSASMLLFPPVEPEGHPRVVLEALAAGIPVVTTDRGAIAETVEDGVSGFVLDQPAPAALADRVCRLLGDERLHERMAEAARARYLECFTQDRADRRLTEWLVEVSHRAEPRSNSTSS